MTYFKLYHKKDAGNKKSLSCSCYNTHLTLLILLCSDTYSLFRKGTHSFKAFYSGTTGITNYPEFTAAGVVDDVWIQSYNSFSKQVVPRTDWMKNSEGPDHWKQQTDIIVGTEQSFKNNIQIAMGRFNHTGGVHTVQQMYGCEWNDETGETNGVDAFGYDGEDFFSLDLKEMRYISPVQQALATTQKWNDNKGLIENQRQYYGTTCIEWLKKYVQFAGSSLKKTVSPQVSLLQKDSSSPVLCHATAFYPSGVKISWLKNGQDHYEDVDIGELVPNEDGSFQKTSTLKTGPEEWKQNQYSCVVEHQGKTINTILTEKDIKTNNGGPPIAIIVGVVAAFAMLVLIGVIGYMVYQRKGKSGFVPANTSDGSSNNSSQGAQA